VSSYSLAVFFLFYLGLNEGNPPANTSPTSFIAYRLSPVRNDLHIAEFFESIFAEFNANP
jgi:hypothetical protein